MWGGGGGVCRKCVHVCGTIPLVFWDNYPNCAPQGKRPHCPQLTPPVFHYPLSLWCQLLTMRTTKLGPLMARVRQGLCWDASLMLQPFRWTLQDRHF